MEQGKQRTLLLSKSHNMKVLCSLQRQWSTSTIISRTSVRAYTSFIRVQVSSSYGPVNHIYQVRTGTSGCTPIAQICSALGWIF